MSKHLMGIDPGLVHTGVVMFGFSEADHIVNITFRIFDGWDADQMNELARAFPGTVFVEDYRARSHWKQDAEMNMIVQRFRRDAKVKLTSNAGATKTITPTIMEVLHVDKFPVTNHRDLQAAARIALLGAARDPTWNSLLYTIITDDLDGRPWSFRKEQA